MPVGQKMPASATTKGLPRATAPLLATAHLTVLAAKNGDPTAQAVIGGALASQGSGGDVVAVLDHAQKMTNRAQYVHFWLYGDGAQKTAGR